MKKKLSFLTMLAVLTVNTFLLFSTSTKSALPGYKYAYGGPYATENCSGYVISCNKYGHNCTELLEPTCFELPR